ncbi:MAG: signal recognition particle-docking protein FtsY [Candidatus Woesearchaeota archaeon]
MFGFLKDKLKQAVGKFSKDVAKETTVEEKEVVVEKPIVKEVKSKVAEKIVEVAEEKPVEKKGFFAKIFGKKSEPEEEIAEKEELLEGLEGEEEIVEEVKKKDEGESNQLSILINKPIHEVFAFTTNPKNTPLWIDSIEYEEANEYPIRIGTEYINVNKKGEKSRYEVLKYAIDKVFQLSQKDSPYYVNYRYEALGSNKTKLTYHEWVDEGILKEPFNISILEKLKLIIEQNKTSLTIKEKSVVKEVSKPIIKEEKREIIKETPKPIIREEVKPVIKEKLKPVIEEPVEKKGFFTKITETFTKFNLSEEKFEELFWELEVVMLENNVAVEVIDKIKQDMKKELLAGKISRAGVEELILATLKKSVTELFDVKNRDLLAEIQHKKKKEGKPYIIAVIGVNGSGKTTSIAKLTHLFQKNGLTVVLAASDTFRAAAIQQLEEHANRLNTKLIKHDYHSDPAAVAFDAIKYAEAKHVDVVIIDTAGRLHSNTNLMRELEKVIRICKPDIKIFVGESITGNDCIEQAKEFDKIAGIDAIILAKADIDEKGGTAISVSYVTGKPIIYLGTGQTYDDLKVFDSQLIIESLEL